MAPMAYPVVNAADQPVFAKTDHATSPQLPRSRKRQHDRLAKKQAKHSKRSQQPSKSTHCQVFTRGRRGSPNEKVRSIILTHERDAMGAEVMVGHKLLNASTTRPRRNGSVKRRVLLAERTPASSAAAAAVPLLGSTKTHQVRRVFMECSAADPHRYSHRFQPYDRWGGYRGDKNDNGQSQHHSDDPFDVIIRCSWCNGFRHRDCQIVNGTIGTSRKCYNCGGWKHLSTDCPSPFRPRNVPLPGA
jgi:hypothetical protein